MNYIFTLEDLAKLAALLKLYKREQEQNLQEMIEIYEFSDRDTKLLEEIIQDLGKAMEIISDDLNYRLQY